MRTSTATTIVLTSALALSAAASPLALEKTATKEVDQASTDLNTDMKISAFSAAIQAAVNQLIAKVNLFDGRITTLETWKPLIQAEVDDLKNRVASLESTVGYLYNTWRPWAESQLSALSSQTSSLNTRVTAIESGGGKGTIVFSGCHVTVNQGAGIAACGTNEVMTQLYHNGLTTGAKQWYSQQTCCKISIQ